VAELVAVHVFEYLDYRVLLRDLFAAKKASARGFSHRAFSRRAGLRSSNYLTLVTKGVRNLTPQMAFRFAEGFGMRKRETDYFCELVAFNQAETAAERARSHERLSRLRGRRESYKLSAAQTEYHASWFLPAIRELASRRDFRDEPAWIARTLQPRITTAQAARALAVLEALSLLKRDARGHLHQAAPIVTTGQGPLGHHVVGYHRAMLDRASQAIDDVPREEREISSLTLCVSHDVLLQLKERIREFRSELLHVAEQQGEPERVVQLNFQLFPLSRKLQAADD
jgi:uncharacterized protein (TIGR02147 family)